jgi:transcriptional regulator with AAA-type ATPase domain
VCSGEKYNGMKNCAGWRQPILMYSEHQPMSSPKEKLEVNIGDGPQLSSPTLILAPKGSVPVGVWTLEIASPYQTTRMAIAEGETWELGSSCKSMFCVADPWVSGKHCRIAVRGGQLQIEDLQSTNGLYAGGLKVRQASLATSGCFVIGRSVVTCLPGESMVGLSSGGEEEPLPDVVGNSLAMRKVAKQVRTLSPLRVPVLIRGETGTGKDLIAQALHNHCQRKQGPYVAVNMGAIAPELVDSELFGHERGAFTGALQARTGHFEAARGGSLFLDEVAEMSAQTQARLLRVLENGEIRSVGSHVTKTINARVLAATWAPLEQRIAENSFREDLYHRLAVFTVHLPPLRDRVGDISLLASHFLKRLQNEVGERELSPHALSCLIEHPWPGNIRELRNVLWRASVQAEQRLISASEIRDALQVPISANTIQNHTEPVSVVRKDTSRAALQKQVRRLFELYEGNISKVSRDVGVARSTIRSWLKETG